MQWEITIMRDECEFWCKLKNQLSPEQRQEILDWEKDQVYVTFEYDYQGKSTWDGNYVANKFAKSDVPNCIHELWPEAVELCEKILLMKNTGNVLKHDDAARKCSITIPLNYTDTCTRFYDDEDTTDQTYIELYHRGEAYLQDNSVSHSVEDNGGEYRYFLQLSFFEKSYNEVKEILGARGYF